MVTVLVSLVLYIIGIKRRIFGIDDIYTGILRPIARILLVMVFAMYLHIKLSNLHMDVMIDKSKTLFELETKEKIQNETKQMFEALQEGILLV